MLTSMFEYKYFLNSNITKANCKGNFILLKVSLSNNISNTVKRWKENIGECFIFKL